MGSVRTGGSLGPGRAHMRPPGSTQRIPPATRGSLRAQTRATSGSCLFLNGWAGRVHRGGAAGCRGEGHPGSAGLDCCPGVGTPDLRTVDGLGGRLRGCSGGAPSSRCHTVGLAWGPSAEALRWGCWLCAVFPAGLREARCPPRGSPSTMHGAPAALEPGGGLQPARVSRPGPRCGRSLGAPAPAGPAPTPPCVCHKGSCPRGRG